MIESITSLDKRVHVGNDDSETSNNVLVLFILYISLF